MTGLSSIMIILSITVSMAVAEEKVCSSFCSSLGMLQSSPGKSCADIYRINMASREVSGLYWINTTTGLHQVNCDMELECGGHGGGWTRIAMFDTSKGDPCPSGWWNTTTPGADSKVVCETANDRGCYATKFTTYNVTFNKICGKVKGYQQGATVAFQNGVSINYYYVDGVSITVGNPRRHVWTYASGLSEDHADYKDNNCPCAAVPGPDPPAFIGNHYYCESGNTGTYTSGAYYTSDPLWDGAGCHQYNNNCCTNPDAPWFFRQFTTPMQEYIEASICHYTHSAYETVDILVESIELYVQ